MSHFLPRHLALLVIGAVCAAPVFAANVERFSVLANAEQVGALVATTTDNRVSIDYHVSNNGRGPKVHEEIVLAKDGQPSEWTIDGTGQVGAKIGEQYRRAAGGPAVHVPRDASPWAFSLYVRALQNAPQQRLQIKDIGTLTLTKLRDLSLGEGASRINTTVYSITGLSLHPDIVLLDKGGHLFAKPDGHELLIREGHEKLAASLQKTIYSMQLQRLQELQGRLAHRFDQPVRIRNVRVFDSHTEKLTEPVSVVVFRNQIAGVQPADEAASADEVVIDAEGGTLVPGLFDMHTHFNPLLGPLTLAAGITGIRDMGNDNEQLLDVTARIERRDLIGPRIVRSGFIEGRSPYSARAGVVVDSLPQALAAARWYADHGYWQIKIYNSMTPDWVKPLAAQAHALGLHVGGHIPAFMSPDRAIRDGYDEIDHINQLMLGWLLKPGEDSRTPLRLTGFADRALTLDLTSEPVRATIQLMKEHHTTLDTTMAIFEWLVLARDGYSTAGDAPYLSHMPIGFQRIRQTTIAPKRTPADIERHEASIRKMIETVGMLYKEGILLLPGTDDMTPLTLHRELELYVAAGIPGPHVLRMATLDSAHFLGLDAQLGSIERGKLASFFVVSGDPTQNVSSIRQITLVANDGAFYLPAELEEAVGVRPFARPLKLP